MSRLSRVASLAAAALTLGSLSAPAPLLASPAPSAAGPAGPWAGQGASFTSSERLDGTFANPVVASDVPDVSTIRVSAQDAGEDRDVYYMISTTMELAPGAPVLKSYDLVNWEIASYVWGVLETNDRSALRNGASSYGQGQWASTIAFHDGTYYVIFNSNNNGRSYLFTTDDIEGGAWERHAYTTSFHDPSLYFDGDTPYVFYGASDTSVARLSPDLRTVEERFPGVITPANFVNAQAGTFTRGDFGPGWEGFQLTMVGDWYYALAISWGRFGRQALVFRSRSLLGAAAGDPYAAHLAIGTKAIAQGGFVSTRPDGVPDQALVFADDYPTGRLPVLVPTAFDAADPDAWPVFGHGLVAGDNSAQVTFPGDLPVPVRLPARERRRAMSASVVASDDFDNDAPDRDWNRPDPPAVPPAPVDPGAPVGTDVVANGGFEAGALAPWTAREGASLRTVSDGAGGSAVEVTGRTSTGSGLHQQLDVDPGSTYRISFRVRPVDPAAAVSTRFIASVDYGAAGPTGQARWVNLASGDAPAEAWTTVTGTYTVPTDRPVEQFQVYVENPWKASPTAVDRPAFLLDDVSLVKTAVPGETWTPAEDADNGSHLALPWQWNHNPDNRHWSLTDREGWLRLTTGRVVTGRATAQFKLTRFEEARNTLTQRTWAPTASAETRMDVSGMRDGDTAGLAVYNRQVSYIAVRAGADGARTLGVVSRPATTYGANPDIAGAEDFLASVALPAGTTEVRVKADLDLRRGGATRNTVQFLYSLDGATWLPLGGANPKLAQWESSHFKGQRFGLFAYAEKTAGGRVDFDYYALSDVLTSQGLPVDTADLDWLVAEAEGLDPADYPAEQWAPIAAALADARAVTGPSTQNQVDAVAQPLNAAIAALPEVDGPVEPQPGATSVTAAAASGVYGQDAAVPVSVTGAGGAPVGGGTVSAAVAGRSLSAPVDAAGRAVLTLPAGTLVPGAHTLALAYGGTPQHAPSSGSVAVSVARAAAALSLSGPRTVRAGRTLRVRIRVAATGVTPAGSVRLVLAGPRGRTVTASLRNGAVTVRGGVPRGARPGARRLRVSYAGSALVGPATATRTVRVTR